MTLEQVTTVRPQESCWPDRVPHSLPLKHCISASTTIGPLRLSCQQEQRRPPRASPTTRPQPPTPTPSSSRSKRPRCRPVRTSTRNRTTANSPWRQLLARRRHRFRADRAALCQPRSMTRARHAGRCQRTFLAWVRWPCSRRRRSSIPPSSARSRRNHPDPGRRIPPLHDGDINYLGFENGVGQVAMVVPAAMPVIDRHTKMGVKRLQEEIPEVPGRADLIARAPAVPLLLLRAHTGGPRALILVSPKSPWPHRRARRGPGQVSTT